MFQNHYKTRGFGGLGCCHGRLVVPSRIQKWQKTIGFYMISAQDRDPISSSKPRPKKGAPSQVGPGGPRADPGPPERHRIHSRDEISQNRPSANCRKTKRQSTKHPFKSFQLISMIFRRPPHIEKRSARAPTAQYQFSNHAISRERSTHN